MHTPPNDVAATANPIRILRRLFELSGGFPELPYGLVDNVSSSDCVGLNLFV